MRTSFAVAALALSIAVHADHDEDSRKEIAYCENDQLAKAAHGRIRLGGRMAELMREIREASKLDLSSWKLDRLATAKEHFCRHYRRYGKPALQACSVLTVGDCPNDDIVGWELRFCGEVALVSIKLLDKLCGRQVRVAVVPHDAVILEHPDRAWVGRCAKHAR